MKQSLPLENNLSVFLCLPVTMCVTYSALFVTDMTSVSVKTLIGTMFSFVSNVSVHVSNNNVQVSRITCLSIIERKVCFNLRTTNLDLYLT